MKIESLQNAKVKEWNKLKEKKVRDEKNCFLIEGDHLLKEALKRNIVEEIIAINSDYEENGIPYYEVTEDIMKKISSQKSSPKVMAICKKLESREIKGRVCILDNLQDPGNLGTIIRSAFAFHIDTIIMSLDTVDLYNEKVIRASEGMMFHINFKRGNLFEEINQLKQKNYQIYGTSVISGENLTKIEFSEKSGIIIGNEGNGMKEELIPFCDKLIHISMNKQCESLNAGVAASIIFYEMSDENA